MSLYDLYQLYAAEIALGTALVVLLLLLWNIWLQLRLSRLHRRYKEAMTGIEGADIEGWLAKHRTTLNLHSERLRVLENYTHQLGKAVEVRTGRLGVVRFNPFQDSGGDLSFAIAWLDDEANGVVLSSLHSREGTRLYAKPLEQGESTYKLTAEELQAIETAKNLGK